MHAAFCGVLALGAGVTAARAQLAPDGRPADLVGVDIDQKLDEIVPLDLPFVDDEGNEVTLRDYFVDGRPVILTLNYYRCPMLCKATLNGMVDALDEIDLRAGDEFQIVTVSINPRETAELAAATKQSYLGRYMNEAHPDGWVFLTGRQENIDTLASAVGFGYRFIPKTEDYAHGASIMFITPEGRISRYMNDVRFDPDSVRLALIEASEGEIGSLWDAFVLWCYHYDPDANSYAADARKIMKLGGLITVIAIVLMLVVLFRRGSARQSRDLISLDGMNT